MRWTERLFAITSSGAHPRRLGPTIGGSLIALGSILSKAFSGNFLEHFALPFCWFMTARRRVSRMLQEALSIKDESESIQSKQRD